MFGSKAAGCCEKLYVWVRYSSRHSGEHLFERFAGIQIFRDPLQRFAERRSGTNTPRCLIQNFR
jgi:hypothetical protein